jgi:hypothetical protein
MLHAGIAFSAERSAAVAPIIESLRVPFHPDEFAVNDMAKD